MSTAVDTVYGSRQSLRGWDADRKNIFETAPDNKKRTAADKFKVESGIKKAENHIGNFDLYDIDEQSLETASSSWTAETHIVWKPSGERYIKSRDNIIKGNLGQVAKEFLKYEESNEFKVTFKGKNGNKPTWFRRCLKRVFKILLKGNIKNLFRKNLVMIFCVHGRKHPLSKLRVKAFKKHCKFTRLSSDAYFENLAEAELNQRLRSLGELNQDENIELGNLVAKTQ